MLYIFQRVEQTCCLSFISFIKKQVQEEINQSSVSISLYLQCWPREGLEGVLLLGKGGQNVLQGCSKSRSVEVHQVQGITGQGLFFKEAHCSCRLATSVGQFGLYQEGWRELVRGWSPVQESMGRISCRRQGQRRPKGKILIPSMSLIQDNLRGW